MAGTTEYDEEVLNAGWMPHPDLQLREAVHTEMLGRKPRRTVDPEEFLRNIYRLQE
ncbi:MAG TPA: hypothetical protein PLT94_14150 [Rhodocyclaceae bacterium]|nr:hypothetical protein [Rhodocyclaceae bacterium]HMV53939.1 hypothetical protein [Rhodocyclaceae bacterium]HMZ84464.1 hypothetical protein [Rhodocyclaceae bacterium]HNA04036.1 hypothetical protein [Rhodocyclaceae bacterium]HNB79667.1 hypothetical protein [Rhodocyclaceae bacterium]